MTIDVGNEMNSRIYLLCTFNMSKDKAIRHSYLHAFYQPERFSLVIKRPQFVSFKFQQPNDKEINSEMKSFNQTIGKNVVLVLIREVFG